jgi:hypothetical protein
MEVLLEIIRWPLGALAGLLFVWCALGNWALLIAGVLGKLERFSLLLPFFGPVFGILCLVIIPIEGLARYWWVAAILEPTWLVGFPCLIQRFLNHKSGSPCL